MNAARRHRDAEGRRLPPNGGFESISYLDRRRPSSAPGRNPPQGRRGQRERDETAASNNGAANRTRRTRDANVGPTPPRVDFSLNDGNVGGATQSSRDSDSPVDSPEVWSSRPQRNRFNPATKLGLALFNEKSKGLPEEKRLALSRSNGEAIHQVMRAREQNISSCVTVPIKFDRDGLPIESAKLLSEHHLIVESDLIVAGHLLFNKDYKVGDKIPEPPYRASMLNPGRSASDRERFYNRVGNNVGVKTLENILNLGGYQDLLEKREKFTYTDASGEEFFHAATMIFIMYQMIDPSTEVSMDLVLKMLENCKMGEHGWNADEMLKHMEKCYRKLKGNRSAPANYRRLLLDALATGKNAAFNTYVARIKDDVEAGYGEFSKITPDELIAATRSKYNNMYHQKIWDKNAPMSAEMMALYTRLTELETAAKSNATALATAGNGTSTNAGNGGGDSKEYVPGTTVEKWRTIPGPPKIKRDGKDWWLCPHHHRTEPPVWGDLYCAHNPDRCYRNPANKKKKAGTGTASSGGDTASKLTLKQNLKAALSTELCMPDEDIDKLLERAEGGN